MTVEPQKLPEQKIAEELCVQIEQVQKTVALLDDGATVPFIARYRKEATGGLTDEQLRTLEKRLAYLRELEERRETILRSVEQQGKLTEALKVQFMAAENKTDLEDLYLPYKPKRQTKAQKAREAGLEPLLAMLLKTDTLDPQAAARDFVNVEGGVDSVDVALEGARHIFIDDCNNNVELVRSLRQQLLDSGQVFSSIAPAYKDKLKDKKVIHFADYVDHREPYHAVPSHRALAMLRGRQQGVLQLKVDLPLDEGEVHPGQTAIAASIQLAQRADSANKSWLSECCRWAWRTRLHPRLESELLTELRMKADEQAIEVFARNLKNLLLAPPAGNRVTMGLDPGLRTGVKVAIVGESGDVLLHDTIFPHEPQKKWEASLAKLKQWVEAYHVELIAIGNGTASRETGRLVSELLSKCLDKDKADSVKKVIVSEAGASVYSASELATQELPDLDVSFRGAVSIARRLQDPLAELVKIEPKSIGVGQYQHDVDQMILNRTQLNVVEDCVNAIGVDVNTASIALLAQVSGISATLAQNIVRYREANGPFPSREALRCIPRFGDRTFELAAGFLRVVKGEQVLDASAVHPEAYGLVQQMAQHITVDVKALIGNVERIRQLSADDFVNEQFGLPTVTDILAELEKPGRDPRDAFKAAEFRDDVQSIDDLKPGMKLEGVVTNVTHFGAFVDIGLYQEGLVHISELSDQFVKDPHAVVRAGDIVSVRVLDIDRERDRVALSMKSDASAHKRAGAHSNTDGGAHSASRRLKPGASKQGETKTKKKAEGARANSRRNHGTQDMPRNTLAEAFNNARLLRK
ncbi:MAG: Tex family protein [Gammaproteobacteria bacterium]